MSDSCDHNDDAALATRQCDTAKGGAEVVHVDFLPLGSDLDKAGALLAIDLIEAGHWHGSLLRYGLPADEDIFTLLGLQHHNGHITVAALTKMLQRQRDELTKHRKPRRDIVSCNTERLGTLLRLDDLDRKLLRIMVIIGGCGGFMELLRQINRQRKDLGPSLAAVLGIPVEAIRRALSHRGTLAKLGLVTATIDAYRGLRELEVDDPLIDAMLTPQFDEGQFLLRLARPAPPARLTLTDFAHLPDLMLVKRYLTQAVARRRAGVNILLYGTPGTGKTEFARALGEAMKVSLFEVPNEGRDGAPLSGQRRYGAYVSCQRFLMGKRGRLLMFDEVEDVFGSIEEDGLGPFGKRGRGSHSAEELRKSWINETLETNPVPAVWICNSIQAIDPAYLRRFDLTVQFQPPSRSVRRQLIGRYFREGEISAPCADRLAQIEALVPAQVERAARVVRALRSRSQARRDAEAERVVAAALQAVGYRRPLTPAVLPAHYDAALLNTDCDLDALAQGLGKGAGARLCLYGPPGTGKTAFAHHLAQRLERPVIVKRASDLQSMFVGECEKNLARAFRQAREDQAILVIDEADGFLRDRGGAHHGWEVSQVNELLTQMEAFDGIFVASTNLIDTLDAASLRRFDFKVKFGYLTREQRRLMLQRVSTPNDSAQGDISELLAMLDRLDCLAPGDFANALRQLHVTGEAPSASRLVQLLAAEAAMKPEARQRPMGFY